MAKGWKTVYTNKNTGNKSDFNAFDKAIRKFSQNHFGVWLSLARALALGARGPEFKSLYPDLEKINIGSHSNLFLDMTFNHNAPWCNG